MTIYCDLKSSSLMPLSPTALELFSISLDQLIITHIQCSTYINLLRSECSEVLKIYCSFELIIIVLHLNKFRWRSAESSSIAMTMIMMWSGDVWDVLRPTGLAWAYRKSSPKCEFMLAWMSQVDWLNAFLAHLFQSDRRAWFMRDYRLNVSNSWKAAVIINDHLSWRIKNHRGVSAVRLIDATYGSEY